MKASSHRTSLDLDMYSFHRDEECARQIYDQVCDAYGRIFEKLELNCYKGYHLDLIYTSKSIWKFSL